MHGRHSKLFVLVVDPVFTSEVCRGCNPTNCFWARIRPSEMAGVNIDTCVVMANVDRASINRLNYGPIGIQVSSHVRARLWYQMFLRLYIVPLSSLLEIE